ncbi:hypothetical protein D0Z06_04780 [Geodermatophilus marinus]|nr:hypothetical protein D0Z06_04780 [Geodermatophilus sp. LHW52908]
MGGAMARGYPRPPVGHAPGVGRVLADLAVRPPAPRSTAEPATATRSRPRPPARARAAARARVG